MPLKIANHWFERKRIDDDITLLWEPNVDPLIRCNIWHVRGRDKDLLVDTGLGIASLKEAAADLFGKSLIAFATHTHFDHTGGIHEFDNRVVHELEAESMTEPQGGMVLRASAFGKDGVRDLREAGYRLENEELITALPHANFNPDAHPLVPAAPTWIVNEGDIIDLGDRHFEVLHLPGHSPGSAGLWEEESGTLFSGDAIYNGPLLYTLPGSNVPTYIKTLERLRELPVRVVHGGHDPSFNRDRLIAIADHYLAQWAVAA